MTKEEFTNTLANRIESWRRRNLVHAVNPITGEVAQENIECSSDLQDAAIRHFARNVKSVVYEGVRVGESTEVLEVALEYSLQPIQTILLFAHGGISQYPDSCTILRNVMSVLGMAQALEAQGEETESMAVKMAFSTAVDKFHNLLFGMVKHGD